jgi:hypothetical protein
MSPYPDCHLFHSIHHSKDPRKQAAGLLPSLSPQDLHDKNDSFYIKPVGVNRELCFNIITGGGTPNLPCSRLEAPEKRGKTMSTKKRVVGILGLGIILVLIFAAIGANAQSYQPYHYYHHYQYDSYPFGNAQAKDYTYDPYPYYRGYTHTHPPYYGFSGSCSTGSPYGDRWGLFVPSGNWHYK